ncbi:MAG: aspartate aminotransferase family protein [Acidimicrobiia bacterium]
MTRERRHSAELATRASARIPGGVNSNVRLDGPRIFFARAEGAWLWDVDGNDYVDYLLGQGPAFLGHAPPPVVAAVEEASRNGMVFGAQNPYEVEAAELLCAILDWPDMVRFGASGTEMVQAAIRLARAATGRTRFIRFGGHYHGWMDNVLVAPEGDDYGVASAGQPADALAHTVVLAWNDLDLVEKALSDGDIAAVIMEPVMLNAGAIAPRPGYLSGVRELCDQHGTILIFDEIITGFRLASGGAVELYGVKPDLATYGKAMAGSWPVGALAGQANLMERFGTGEVVHAGTFNANVMGMAAVAATLRLLKESPPYPQMEEIGTRLIKGLEELCQRRGLPLRLQGWPMAFHASFGEDIEVWDHRDLIRLDQVRYRKLVTLLTENGVWVAGRGIWYLSAAHGKHEIDVTLDRVEAALSAL